MPSRMELSDKSKPEEWFPSPIQECPPYCSQLQTSHLPLPGHTECSSVCLPTHFQHLLSLRSSHRHLIPQHTHTHVLVCIYVKKYMMYTHMCVCASHTHSDSSAHRSTQYNVTFVSGFVHYPVSLLPLGGALGTCLQ